MPIIAKDNRKEYEPAPEGMQQAVCVDVIDLGMQETPWGRKPQVEIRWQSVHVNPQTDKRYLIRCTYTNSLNENANLRKHLDSWRGKPFRPEQLLAGFDLEKLIGVNCHLQIIHHQSKAGRLYGKIQSIVQHMEGVKIEPDRYDREQYEEVDDSVPTGSEDEVPF
ncbi:MAG: phage replication initiation protein, NGO0469 family [Planctomycetota bacterium]|jgi:hypothetical protein